MFTKIYEFWLESNNFICCCHLLYKMGILLFSVLGIFVGCFVLLPWMISVLSSLKRCAFKGTPF